MLCYESWPEEQWRYAVNKEEEKNLGSSCQQRQKRKQGRVIHMVIQKGSKSRHTVENRA